MANLKDRKKMRLLARFGAALILLFFLLLISLPNLIDLDNYRPQLLDYLQSQFVGEVAVGKLGLTFEHGPGLRVDGVRVYDETGSQHLFVTTAIINFDLSYMFKRRLHVGRLTLVRPDIVLRLDDVESFQTAFLRPQESSDAEPEQSPPAAWGFDREISGAQVEIIDGSVEFTDNCFCISPITIRLKKLNSFFSWHETETLTKFKLTAITLDEAGDGTLQILGSLSNLKIPLQPGKMVLKCKVDAENLNAGNYFPYYQEYVPMRFVGGRLDVDGDYNGSLMGLFSSKGRLVLHQAELDYQQVFKQKLEFDRFAVDYNFRLADSYNTIETRDCTINADGLIVQGYCLLYEARRGIDGTIEAKLNSSKFNPKTILPLLPWEIIPQPIQQYCDKLQSQGSLVVENAYLKGDYRKITRLLDKDPPAGIIGGHLRAENLSFSTLKNWPPISVARADVTLAEDTLKVENLNLAIKDTLTCESGIFLLQNIFQKLEMAFSGHLKLDLKGLNPYLENLFAETVSSGQSKASPVTFNRGSIAGELVFEGPPAHLDKLRWGGTLSGKDISFAFAGSPFKVENGAALFTFAGDTLRIDSATLDFATLPLTLQGTVPGPGSFFKGKEIGGHELKLSVQGSEFSPEQLNLLSGEAYNINGVEAGPSSFKIDLNANSKDLSAFKLAGMLDLKWGDVRLPFVDKPIEKFNCKAEFDREKIVFENFDLRRGKSEFLFRGDLHKDRESSNYMISGKVASAYFAVDDFFSIAKSEKEDSKELIPLSFDLDGAVSRLVLPAVASEKKSSSKDLWRNLDDFKFSLAGGGGLPIAIKECRWHWGGEQAQVNISGELQSFDSLHGNLGIEISDIDLDALFSIPEEKVSTVPEKISSGKLQNEPVKAVLLEGIVDTFEDDLVSSFISWKEVLALNDLNINLRAQHLRWQQMILDRIGCDCHINAEGVNIDRLTGRIFDGNFNLYAGWCFADDSFMLESQLDDINFESLNDYLKNPDRGLPMLGGDGSFTLDLYWQGGSLKSWEESLDGELDFNFQNGRLKRFTLIANICSLLNLSQFAALRMPEFSIDKGIPYHELAGRGLIIDGLLGIDEYDMRGPSFNLFGNGEIDLINDQIDFELGIQPLQAVDKILASIPVVGYIMTGDKKTFVVVPITVRGPFDNLEIRTQTILGMGKKVGGMVQRFFKTPVRLLRMPGKIIEKMGAANNSEVREDSAVQVR